MKNKLGWFRFKAPEEMAPSPDYDVCAGYSYKYGVQNLVV
jgi:hypothetical protein